MVHWFTKRSSGRLCRDAIHARVTLDPPCGRRGNLRGMERTRRCVFCGLFSSPFRPGLDDSRVGARQYTDSKKTDPRPIARRDQFPGLGWRVFFQQDCLARVCVSREKGFAHSCNKQGRSALETRGAGGSWICAASEIYDSPVAVSIDIPCLSPLRAFSAPIHSWEIPKSSALWQASSAALNPSIQGFLTKGK